MFFLKFCSLFKFSLYNVNYVTTNRLAMALQKARQESIDSSPIIAYNLTRLMLFRICLLKVV